MNKRIACILTLLCIFLAVLLAVKPIVLYFAEKSIHDLIKADSVSIKGFNLKPNKVIAFYDVDIKKDKAYDVKIKEAKIYYNLSYGNSKNLVNRLELSNLNLNFKTDTLDIKANGSLGVDLSKKIINYTNLKIPFLKVKDLEAENGFLDIGQDKKEGRFYVERLNYNKIKLAQIRSNAVLENNKLSMDNLSIDFLGGRLEGSLSMLIDKDVEYSFKLRALNLDIERLVKDFELTEKFEMTGPLGGVAVVEGKGFQVTLLNGDFSADKGGILIIKDNRFLKNIAKRSGQSLSIIVESFKNYHYNIGNIKMRLDKDNLVLDVHLDGETGKRDLAITVHTL